jgi:hypothetical protein
MLFWSFQDNILFISIYICSSSHLPNVNIHTSSRGHVSSHFVIFSIHRLIFHVWSSFTFSFPRKFKSPFLSKTVANSLLFCKRLNTAEEPDSVMSKYRHSSPNFVFKHVQWGLASWRKLTFIPCAAFLLSTHKQATVHYGVMYQRQPATGFTNEVSHIETKPYVVELKTRYLMNQEVASGFGY